MRSQSFARMVHFDEGESSRTLLCDKGAMHGGAYANSSGDLCDARFLSILAASRDDLKDAGRLAILTAWITPQSPSAILGPSVGLIYEKSTKGRVVVVAVITKPLVFKIL